MKREWQVEASEGRDAVVQALVECEAIGERLGGAFTIIPVRQAYTANDGQRGYYTRGWLFIHDSYVPAIEDAVPTEEPEPEPVTVPDEWDEPAAEAE